MINPQKLDLVLLIDDDELVNTLNTIMLRQSGYVEQIQAVDSGDKALDTLAQYENENLYPSIIFVDINMPGLSGWEFLEIFKTRFLSFKQKSIICMLSSSLNPIDRQRAEKSDLVDFYFTKPLTPQIVQTLYENAVAHLNQSIRIN